MAHAEERQGRHDQRGAGLAIGLIHCFSHTIRDRSPGLSHKEQRPESHASHRYRLCAAVEVSAPTVVDLGCRLLYK